MSKRLKWIIALFGLACVATVALAAITPTVGIWFDPQGNWMRARDNIDIQWGSDSDIVTEWDGDSLDIEPAANNTAINIGTGTYNCDITMYGSSLSNAIVFDASDNALETSGAVSLTLAGTGGVLTSGPIRISTGNGPQFSASTAGDVLAEDVTVSATLVVNSTARIDGNLTLNADISRVDDIQTTSMTGGSLVITGTTRIDGNVTLNADISRVDDIQTTSVTAGSAVVTGTTRIDGNVTLNADISRVDDIQTSTITAVSSIACHGNVTLEGDISRVDDIQTTSITAGSAIVTGTTRIDGNLTLNADISRVDDVNSTRVYAAELLATSMTVRTSIAGGPQFSADQHGDVLCEDLTTSGDVRIAGDILGVDDVNTSAATVGGALDVASSMSIVYGVVGNMWRGAYLANQVAFPSWAAGTTTWTLTRTHMAPTTTTDVSAWPCTYYTTCTVPLTMGSRVDEIRVRAAILNETTGSLIVHVGRTDGDGTISLLNTTTVATGVTAWGSHATTSFDYTANADESLIITLQANDEEVQVQSLIVVYDTYGLGQ